jgi:hypothetical protein
MLKVGVATPMAALEVAEAVASVATVEGGDEATVPTPAPAPAAAQVSDITG